MACQGGITRRKSALAQSRQRPTIPASDREHATGDIVKFDYQMPAELFMAKRKGGSKRLGYRRFATAAEAIRFAVEDFPAIHTLGAYMQVGDERFDSDGIHRLYESSDYPLRRAE
jgi:hypothetical protein